MSAIVHVLWGDSTSSKFNRLWKEISTQIKHPYNNVHKQIYVYGQENHDRLVDLIAKHNKSWKVRLVDSNPYPDGKTEHPLPGDIYIPWHYKTNLLKVALSEHDQIVYTDWDILCYARSNEDVFARLQGREMTFSAYRYKGVRHYRRKTRRAKRIAISGNFLHFTSPTFLDMTLEHFKTGKWLASWHDEIAMGEVFDILHNGWIGEEEWLRKYESPIMCQKDYRCPWYPIVSDDGDKVTRETPIPFEWNRIFVQWSRHEHTRPSIQREMEAKK